MKPDGQFSVFRRYQAKWVLLLAVAWTIADLVRFLVEATARDETNYPYTGFGLPGLLIHVCLVMLFSVLLIYVLVFRMKKLFPSWKSLWNHLVKVSVLAIFVIIITSIVFLANSWIFVGYSFRYGLERLLYYSVETSWMLESIFFWFLVFVPTQLMLEVSEKYSPGVFAEIFWGKYVHPQEENRVIMFIDLKDSTPIAEQLGHQKYFLFIRDFIHFVSAAMLEYNGRIYQYVGDEVVVSWNSNTSTDRGKRAPIQALIAARKLLQQENAHFRQAYGVIPEFRVGIHAGKVMVGEIGLIKKDLAMSGDAMNITARIRSASSELNHRFIMSKDFVELIDLKTYQAKSLGMVDLKGKDGGIELFSLHI